MSTYDAEKNTMDGKPLSEYKSEPYEKGFKHPVLLNLLIGAILIFAGGLFGMAGSFFVSAGFSTTGCILIIRAIFMFLKGK